MTEEERRAWIRMLAVLLVAAGARTLWLGGVPSSAAVGAPRDAAAALDTIGALADEAERRARPLAAGERLDPNRADEVELDRLPGVGPATAAAIVSARTEAPFEVPSDLVRVRGIGPATAERLAPHLELAARPSSPARVAGARRPTADTRIDLNRADSTELTALPGIGPALAGRIVAERLRGGPFEQVQDLERVPGIGPATVARLRAQARTR